MKKSPHRLQIEAAEMLALHKKYNGNMAKIAEELNMSRQGVRQKFLRNKTFQNWMEDAKLDAIMKYKIDVNYFVKKYMEGCEAGDVIMSGVDAEGEKILIPDHALRRQFLNDLAEFLGFKKVKDFNLNIENLTLNEIVAKIESEQRQTQTLEADYEVDE